MAELGSGWRTVPDLLLRCAEHRPDVPLLVAPDGAEVPSTELLRQVLCGAETLRRRGIDRDSLVAVDTATLSWHEAAAAYFAVVWLGATAVMVVDEVTEELAFEEVGASTVVSVEPRDCPGLTPAELFAGPPFAGESPARPTDRLDLVFTSGTTGRPKPVASSHDQWTGAVRPEIVASRARRTVAHSGVPIGVSGGLHGILLNHVARGVTSVRGRTVAELAAICRAREVYELHLTPHTARSLLRMLDPHEEWTSGVKLIRVVGAPVPASVASGLSDAFPRARVVSLYGLTEGGPAVFVKVVDRRTAERGDLASIGRPLPGSRVRVLDDDGREVPAGQVGELAIRAGEAEPLAYAFDDTLNRAWFHDGWARTGDLGYVDATGAVRLVGRVKELIFLKGGRISPEAVEEILSRVIPAGVEFAVAGLPTEGGWDRIAVFLVGDDTSLAPVRADLATFRGPFRPREVRVVERIPRGPSGKPLRRRLAQLL